MFILDLWHSIPNEIKVLIISMSPFFELRLSIPMGIFYYHIPTSLTFVLSIIGNTFVIIPTMLFLEHFISFLMKKVKLIDKICTKIFEKTKHKHTKSFNLYGALGLILIVALPLPGTGAYSGALIAYVFGVPIQKALPLLSAGVIIAGFIVTILSMGVNASI
jgi:uncharacterized membrane protein